MKTHVIDNQIKMSSQNDLRRRRVYIGTYTEGTLHYPHDKLPVSEGIYTAVYDTQTGVFDDLQPAARTPNPSYLAKHPARPILYSVNECIVEQFQCGGLSIFRTESDGRLTFLDRFPTRGQAPCHIFVDPQGRFLLVSNYRDGRFVRFSLDQNGLPYGEPEVFQSEGKGCHEKRQSGPHAHFSTVDPLTDNIMMVDLGTDTVYVRKYDEHLKTFSNDNRLDLKVDAGSGSRHLVLSPDAGACYVVGELKATISVFRRNDENVFEGPIQSLSTLPPDNKSTDISTNTGSAIAMHPSGKYVYASNRGSGIVSVFRVEKNRRLIYHASCETRCKIPRFCCLSPDGQCLFVCGQDSASIETYSIDIQTGRLFFIQTVLPIDSPACVAW